MMLEERSEDFKTNFLGTHFFNPPRYLELLEIIPTPHTNPKLVEFLMEFGDRYLGKTTVLFKDTHLPLLQTGLVLAAFYRSSIW